MSVPPSGAHFRASADVLTRLGAELITDNTQALLELIKNAYDADAQSVSVLIDTVGQYEVGGETYTGKLTVSDSGHGMDRTAITDGWLMLSASPKRAFKEAGKTTKRGRTPLGDKGLGRLGAQRLGNLVSLTTRPPRPAGRLPKEEDAPGSQPDTEHRVRFRFSDFHPDVLLEAVDVTHDELPVSEVLEPWPLKTAWGTKLELYGLYDVDRWRQTNRLETELSKIINPFTGVSRFAVSVVVDGHRLNLARIGNDVRRAAMTTWRATFDGDSISIRGRIRPQFFRLRDADRQERLEHLIAADGGDGLVKAIGETTSLNRYNPQPGSDQYLVELQYEKSLHTKGADVNFDPVWLRRTPPGPFAMEIDTVALQLATMRSAELHVFDKQKEYRDWIRERAGIGIYRDGFRVAAAQDLLGLGQAFSTGGSFYGLRPANVLGYIAITARENRGLQETTDREGLRDTPHSQVFNGVLNVIRDAINQALDELGRLAGTYEQENARSAEDTNRPLDELADETRTILARTHSATRTVETAGAAIRKLATNPVLRDHPTLIRDLDATAASLEETGPDLEGVQRLRPLIDAISTDVRGLRDQLTETYELVGLGLTAETLAHELSHIVARLSDRSATVRPIVAAMHDPDPEFQVFVEEVDGVARSLRGQLRHLNPQLRYARERRETVALDELVRDIFEHHRERLRADAIDLVVTAHRPATVRVARGRIIQIVDNLVINAEYWVGEALRLGKVDRGKINAHVAGSSITVSDNGPGVAAELGPSAFDAFVSDKVGGRGLGLFISRQLLAAEGGSIELLPTPGAPSSTFVVTLDERVVDA